jgi:hypothetical protein
MLTIQSDTLGGTIFWKELHYGIVTSPNGMFSLVVGKGFQVDGMATSFGEIDWSTGVKWLKTEIDHGGWNPMGSSRLWSVPYAIAAGDISGALKKLEVAGETTALDEALFEVRNKNGQTVFAVYNEGVRIYVGDGENKAVKGGFAIGGFDETKQEPVNLMVVNRDSVRVYIYDDSLAKAVKGGFAIGGFDGSKGLTNDYLRVSPDSVRIYIDESSGKSVKGGFAIGGFDESKATGSSYLNVATDPGGIVNPSENRILWYPLKNAFLTGRVLIEKPDSVGENSFASGFESKAKGQYSQALGYQAIARGNNSTSIGYQSVAHMNNSFSFGQFAQAVNEETYAFGRGALAEGYRSYSFGSAGVDTLGTLTGVAYAKGDYSFAIGQGSQSLGRGAFSIGIADTARGNYSLALGYTTSAGGLGSTAMGMGTSAKADYSTAMGFRSSATGRHSIALGYISKAMGEISVAIGTSAVASGYSSVSLGDQNTASGTSSIAMGMGTTASEQGATSMGYRSNASGFISTAMGRETSAKGSYSLATGYLTMAGEFASTAMGNGSIALAPYSTAIGDNVGAISAYETVIGRWNTDYSPVSPTGWNGADRLFVIANGQSKDIRSDALVVLKNGNVGIGSNTPAHSLVVPNSARIANHLFSGYFIEMNEFGTGNRYSMIDMHSDDTYTDYALRLIRYNTGPNANSRIHHRGTGILELYAQEAGSIVLYTSGLGRMYVTSGGNIGVNTSSPTQMLDVTGNARFRSIASDAYYGVLNRKSDGTLTTATSDIRMKENVATLSNSLDKVLMLRGVSFTWKSEPSMGTRIGMIAQEVEAIIPELVFTNDLDGYKGINYAEMSAVLVEAMKEQQKRIEATEAENRHLREELASMNERLVKLESLLVNK